MGRLNEEEDVDKIHYMIIQDTHDGRMITSRDFKERGELVRRLYDTFGLSIGVQEKGKAEFTRDGQGVRVMWGTKEPRSSMSTPYLSPAVVEGLRVACIHAERKLRRMLKDDEPNPQATRNALSQVLRGREWVDGVRGG